MALQCGIVGLPNVGKSTLFNCLSNAKAQAANFPFCTIEPNVGVITVPDERLIRLAEIDRPKRVIPTTIEIVDIAWHPVIEHWENGTDQVFLLSDYTAEQARANELLVGIDDPYTWIQETTRRVIGDEFQVVM